MAQWGDKKPFWIMLQYNLYVFYLFMCHKTLVFLCHVLSIEFYPASFIRVRSSMWTCFSGWFVGNLAIHPAISQELTGRAEAYFWNAYLYSCLLDKEQLVEQTSITDLDSQSCPHTRICSFWSSENSRIGGISRLFPVPMGCEFNTDHWLKYMIGLWGTYV